MVMGQGLRLVAAGMGLGLVLAMAAARVMRSVVFDVDKELARRTRERLMRELEDPSTISADGHFSDVVFGRVLPAQGKRYWRGIP